MIRAKITNASFNNVHTAISLANGSNADIEIDKVTLNNCVKGIEERDPPSLLGSLGLPPETPADLVLEVLRELRDKPGAGPAEQQEIIKASKLWPFAERAANLTVVFQGLAAIAGSALGIPGVF